jgi:uncharacterized RDD family membrane protein YckC
MTFFIDLVCVYISFFILGAVIHAIGMDALLAGRSSIFGLVVIVLYYILQEAFWGRTLGKAVAGTKVVREDGTPISFGQALVRSICRFIPFEQLSFFGGHGHPVGWHDRIAKTKVVSVSQS